MLLFKYHFFKIKFFFICFWFGSGSVIKISWREMLKYFVTKHFKLLNASLFCSVTSTEGRCFLICFQVSKLLSVFEISLQQQKNPISLMQQKSMYYIA